MAKLTQTIVARKQRDWGNPPLSTRRALLLLGTYRTRALALGRALATLALLSGWAPSALASDVKFLIIDQRERAYTLFTGIPGGIPQDKLKEIRLHVAQPRVGIASWETFLRSTDEYLKKNIVKNEYQASQLVNGIVELIKKYPGTPVGVTWNGGVAITQKERDHAKSTYQHYLDNPAEYERTRTRDPRLDPVNPTAHFGSLLGW